MKTIEYGGCFYLCPLSDRFRRHSADERERMDGSGDIEYPVLIYTDTTLEIDENERCVLDGEGRLETAARTGRPVEFRDVGELTTDEAFERAKALNDARRHDDPESIRKRRAERIERVAEKRAEGKSLRTIAEEEGVSRQTVLNDLDESGVNPLTPEAPEKVTGKDGRQQAAKKKPKPTPESETRPEPDEPAEADPLAEFVGRINRACAALDALKKTVAEIAAEPTYGRHLHGESIAYQIESARKALWQSRPTEACNCVRGGEANAKCKACFGTGKCPASRVLKGGR